MSGDGSGSGSSFLYIDDSGDVQGPFTEVELREWRQLNYFTDETLVRQYKEGEDASKAARGDFKPFGIVLGSNSEVSAAAVQPSASSTTIAATEPAVTIEDENEDVEMEETPAAPSSSSISQATSTTSAVHVSPSTASNAAASSASAAVAPESNDAAPSAPVSTQWYYLDDSGSEQGPFSSEDMSTWFAADYFNGDTKLRCQSETECKPFKDRTERQPTFMKTKEKQGSEDDDDAAAVSAVDARQVVNPEDEFEVDEDEYLHDQLMDAEDAEGEGSKDDTGDKTKDSDIEDGSEEEDDGAEKPSKKRARVASPVPVEALKWYYIDTGEVSHGPYSSWAMLTWHRKGFFAFHDTPLRREDESVAVPLSKRTEAPSFFRASAPISKKEQKARALAEKIAKERSERKLENRWYYLDAKDVEQGPFTEAQMRGWWENNFLKPTLKIRQVGEDESEYSTIESRGDKVPFTKPAPPVPQAPLPPMMQQQHGYPMNYHSQQQPYAGHAPMPYGGAAPYPYAQQGGYAPGPYHNAPHYGAAGGNNRAPREDYTQQMGFDRRRGGYAAGRGPPNQYDRR